METMESHAEKMGTQMKHWGAKLDALAASAEAAGASAKADHRKQIDDLKAKFQVAQTKLAELRTASSGTWESLKTGTESAWKDFEGAFKKLTS